MCVCARRQPSPIAASPGSPWSPVRVSPCPAVSAPGLPPNIVHTVLAAALAIPLASATCLLVAGVDTLGGREGENPRRAVRRSARSARRARSYRLAKLSYERG